MQRRCAVACFHRGGLCRETGDAAFLDMPVPYADKGTDTVYGHLKTILDFSQRMVGAHGICQGLRADWNDCLNLGGGESAMVSFLHVLGTGKLCRTGPLVGPKGRRGAYTRPCGAAWRTCVKKSCGTADGICAASQKTASPIGTDADTEGKVHLESNTWAVLSGAAGPEQGRAGHGQRGRIPVHALGPDAQRPVVHRSATMSIGFVTRVYPGVKENGSIFSHPNPWAWAAECQAGARRPGHEVLQRPAVRRIRTTTSRRREAEPYSYCQFIMGRDHTDIRPRAASLHDRLRRLERMWPPPAICWASGRSSTALTVGSVHPRRLGRASRAVRRCRGAGVPASRCGNPAHVCKGVKALSPR